MMQETCVVAGFSQKVEFIEEPYAALRAFGLAEIDEKARITEMKRVIVIHVGGCTTQISILKRISRLGVANDFDYEAYEHDEFLGGDDID